jgi:EmrB/QacA subfamily drug resistance transporter
MQRKWLVTCVVCAGVFMASLDLFIVNIAFPAISRHFAGASIGSLSWILSAYAIVFAALLVPAGRWADAFGRKRAFLLGLAVFVIASAACAAAPSVGTLVAARILQAAGGALMVPTSLGLVLPEFEPSERHAAIGVWAATGGTAAAAGPPLGGLLVQADWRLVFLVNVPVGIVGLIAGTRVLCERRDSHAVRPDVVGAAGVVAAVGTLVVAIVEGQSWGWSSAAVLTLVAVSLLLTAWIWRRCLHHPQPILEPAIMRIRTFRLAVLGSFLFFAAFAAMLLGNVLFLTSAWHEHPLAAGLMLFPGPAAAAAFSVPSARLGARYGFRLPGVLGAALFAAGSLWYIARAGDHPAFAAAFLPGMIVGGAGVGLVIPTLTAAGAGAVPPERFATGAAVLTMGRQIGAALGIAILVAVIGADPTRAGDFHAAWLITVAGALAAGLVLAAIGPPAIRRASAPAVAEGAA